MAQWRSISGYPGYMVSDCGDVKGPRKILSQQTDPNGYKRVSLGVNKSRKSFLVHRLVATAFIENSGELKEVNHKDENKTNNHFSNLEWCDRLYNVRFGTGIERAAAGKSKPILQFDKNGNLINRWESTQDASRHGFNQARICYCAQNKPRYKTYKGCIWKYE